MRTIGAVCTALGLAVVISGLSGCGSAPGGPWDGSEAVVNTYLRPFADNPSQSPRWMDTADNLYSSAFQMTYAYPEGAVRLDYTTQETPLRFIVTAGRHALKPNFCYQMKIEGPAKQWGGDPTGSDLVNYQLGSSGRWWCDTCNKSLTDADVSSGAHTGHLVKGYLYFDFLVTGADGSVEQTSAADSSYHVTWKTSQRGRTANDGVVRTYTVVAGSDGWAYDRSRRSKTIGLYGEWEPGRPLPGQVALAAGTYSGVQFRLTEESFHSSNPSGGNWRTVMVADMPDFEISGAPPPIHDVAVTDISVPGSPPRSGQPRNVVVTISNEGTVGETTSVSLIDLTQGSVAPSAPVPVTVGAGKSATASFVWTPTGRGTHVLQAEAAAVSGETDTSDNTATRTVSVK